MNISNWIVTGLFEKVYRYIAKVYTLVRRVENRGQVENRENRGQV